MNFSKKSLRKLIIPLILEQLLAVTVGMADTMMVSRAGEAAVSGISLVDTINFLLITLFSSLATGGAVVAAQYIGRKQPEKACRAANQLFLAVTLVAVGVMVFSLLGNQLLLQLIFGHVDVEVMRAARTYFLVSAISYPFLGIYNAGSALFRSMGNSKVGLYISLCMNAVNITGNAIFIYVFHIDVLGVALASLISRILGAVIISLLIRRQSYAIHIDRRFRLGYEPHMIRRILRIGVPGGLESSMFQVGKILLQSLTASFGTAAIAANAMAGNIVSFETLPGSAIGLALITIVGQCIGAGDCEAAQKYTKKLLKLTYGILFLVSIAIVLFRNPIMGIYNMSEKTTEIAGRLILWHSLMCFLVWTPSFALPNAFRAANDVKYTMVIAIVSMWVFRIGSAYLLARGLGLGVLGIWMAMTVDWIFRAVCFTKRFLTKRWLRLHMEPGAGHRWKG